MQNELFEVAAPVQPAIIEKVPPLNFQRLASEQGREWRDICVKALERAGFTEIRLEERIPDVGVTLDIAATNRRGISVIIECKGSMMNERPGCKRTDTVLKAIAEAYLLTQSALADYFPPMILMTSHVAEDGAARAMLGAVPLSIIADVLNPYNHAKRIAWWANATEETIKAHLNRYRSVEDLLVKWNC